MNYNLLVRYRGGVRQGLITRDWLFFFVLLIGIAVVVLLPIVIVVGLYHLLRGGT
jgi:hypothetical protein